MWNLRATIVALLLGTMCLPAVAGTTQVAMFTGFSIIPDPNSGMSELNSFLATSGLPNYAGLVFEWDDRESARDWIASHTDRDTLILVGHSFGGNATLQLANNLLKPLGIDVDLTVQIDTVENFDGGWNTQLPSNVDVGYNYFQHSTGLFEPQGEFVVNGATNIDAEIFFNDTSITHTSIDNDVRLHNEILQHILDNLNYEDADFDDNDLVDGKDFLKWQQNAGTLGGGSLPTGDANNDKDVNDLDFAIWEEQFAQMPAPAVAAAVVPEPSSILLLSLGFGLLGWRRLGV